MQIAVYEHSENSVNEVDAVGVYGIHVVLQCVPDWGEGAWYEMQHSGYTSVSEGYVVVLTNSIGLFLLDICQNFSRYLDNPASLVMEKCWLVGLAQTAVSYQRY